MKIKTVGKGVMIILMVLFLVGCSNNTAELPKADALIEGKIVDLDENGFLFTTDTSSLIRVGMEGTIYDEDNQETDVSSLKLGQWIEIGFSGAIMESYPGQLADIKFIHIVEQQDNMVGFYRMVIDDLWQTDEGLNSDIEYIALDLSQITNLSESEKQALLYLTSGQYKLTGLSATYEELVDQGYIDGENLYFEDGLLFTFDIKSTSDTAMKFDVTKWRSGLGAYFFMDCEAKKTKDGWTYEVGSEAIS
ncbi:MAG: YobA family protein [Clostridiales bacterium]|nr:YobA family protein [Clostridiales bacterium]